MGLKSPTLLFEKIDNVYIVHVTDDCVVFHRIVAFAKFVIKI